MHPSNTRLILLLLLFKTKDADGRIVNPAAFYTALYKGSCAPELRKTVWKTLLGQYPLSFSDDERSTRDAEVKLAFEARQKELAPLVAALPERYTGNEESLSFVRYTDAPLVYLCACLSACLSTSLSMYVSVSHVSHTHTQTQSVCVCQLKDGAGRRRSESFGCRVPKHSSLRYLSLRL